MNEIERYGMVEPKETVKQYVPKNPVYNGRCCANCGHGICKSVNPDSVFMICLRQDYKYWKPKGENNGN